MGFLLSVNPVVPFLIVVASLLVIAVIVIIANIKIVPQATAQIVERLGSYKATWNTGLHFKLPFVDKVLPPISLKEDVKDFDKQDVITRDNVTMTIDTVVFYQVTDCKLYTYGITNPITAIKHLTATTLRNIVGELDLDETLTSRDVINAKMRSILDEATDPWGIKVTRVELKSIEPPADIKEAMEKQMRAERERREAILKAEGEKNSTILVAEGRKQEAILEAEAEKEAAILRAEAERESAICRAEGEAESILKIHEARAKGLAMIKEVDLTQTVIALRSLEALEKVADGQATKIIIPSEIQNIAGLVSSIAEASKTEDKK